MLGTEDVLVDALNAEPGVEALDERVLRRFGCRFVTCVFDLRSKLGRRIQQLVRHLHVDPVSSSFEAGLDHQGVVP
ncbi:MAG: hypothetical protein OEQ49_03380 [Myxococcales bacterium]|nr:hypothetical protein [Myxococcales bacterium]